MILSRLLVFLESNSILSPRQAGFRLGWPTLDQIRFLYQTILDEFNQLKPGSRTIRAIIDFSKALSTLSGTPPFSINSFRLVGLNLFFLMSVVAWFIKITKVVPFESVEAFLKDPFLALYFSFFSSMAFLLLCLLPSAALFMLKIWPFSPTPFQSLLRWRPHKEL